MSLLTRRALLASGFATAVASKATLAETFLSPQPAKPSLPTLWWSESSEAHIEIADLLPTTAATERFEELVARARSSRRLIVHATGRIAPVEGCDSSRLEWPALFERFGVNEVIETSDRSRQVTSPIRVGEIDPAGIVYRIND